MGVPLHSVFLRTPVAHLAVALLMAGAPFEMRVAHGARPPDSLARSDSVTLWVGDTLLVPLTHAAVVGPTRWYSADPGIARVVAPATVLGVRPGVTTVRARGESTEVAIAVAVLPLARGVVHVPGDAPLGALRAVVRREGGVDSAEVSADGGFVVRLSSLVTGGLDLWIREPDTLSPRYHPARIRTTVSALAESVGVVMIPTTWTVPGGRYAGRTIGVSVMAALALNEEGSRFCRIAQIAPGAPWQPTAWPNDRLPIPISFSRRRGDGRVSERDSVAFWAIIEQLEGDAGMDLFQPATATGDPWQTNLIDVRITPRLGSDGATFLTWSHDGDIFDAEVRVRASSVLHDEAVITHEMIHALGFGHTRSWPSLMTPRTGSSARLTADDAAYLQLAYAVRATQRRHSARYGLVEAGEAAGAIDADLTARER